MNEVAEPPENEENNNCYSMVLGSYKNYNTARQPQTQSTAADAAGGFFCFSPVLLSAAFLVFFGLLDFPGFLILCCFSTYSKYKSQLSGTPASGACNQWAVSGGSSNRAQQKGVDLRDMNGLHQRTESKKRRFVRCYSSEEACSTLPAAIHPQSPTWNSRFTA